MLGVASSELAFAWPLQRKAPPLVCRERQHRCGRKVTVGRGFAEEVRGDSLPAAFLLFCAPVVFASFRAAAARRRLSSNCVLKASRRVVTALRYKSAAASTTDACQPTDAVPAASASNKDTRPWRHPPRAARGPKKLPFSDDDKFWDFTVYPKALFPWSPEAGGRPWHSVTNIHKVRLGFVAAVHLGCLAAPFTFTWDALQVCLVLWFITSFGLCCSFHRQLSHRAFECPKWLEYLFAYFACLAVEGGPIGWVRMHRYHHVHSDEDDDTHSPMDGFWWSHMGFMFDPSTPEKLKDASNTRDLDKQWFYRLMDDQVAFAVLTILLPLATLFAFGGMPYIVWGFCVRTVLVWHVNWGINSAGHVWGYQSYKSGDHSMNNPVLGILGLGDGWHNNHHAFPRSCRHGLAWHEIDVVWYVLLILSGLGLAWNLQYPSEKRLQQLAL